VITAMGRSQRGYAENDPNKLVFQEKPEAVKRGKDADPDEQAVARTEQRQGDCKSGEHWQALGDQAGVASGQPRSARRSFRNAS